MAARCFNAPIATVSFVDTDRIWFKAIYGLDGIERIGRDPGLCASAILDDAPYLACDAQADPQASNRPLVRGDWGIRFYAGAPIVTADGHRLGTVDVFDTRPRQPTDDQVALLADLAAALHYSDPIEVLAELNRVLIRKTSENRFCTVLFDTLRPSASGPGFEMTIATGSHLPALRLDAADGAVDEIDSEGGMLAGALADATFEACTMDLRPGQTLVLYTDGLVETRAQNSAQFGEDELADFIASGAALTTGELVDELAALILTLRPRDDIAVLALSCCSPG
jgi:hypothetical protein